MTMSIIDTSRIRIFALVEVTLLLLSGCSSNSYGAKVFIHNVDSVPLHSVIVRVTGNVYSIGELAASQTRTVNTYLTGESHIIIEHIDASGEKKELPVDCYFEPGYRSIINVQVRADSVTKVE